VVGSKVVHLPPAVVYANPPTRRTTKKPQWYRLPEVPSTPVNKAVTPQPVIVSQRPFIQPPTSSIISATNQKPVSTHKPSTTTSKYPTPNNWSSIQHSSQGRNATGQQPSRIKPVSQPPSPPINPTIQKPTVSTQTTITTTTRYPTSNKRSSIQHSPPVLNTTGQQLSKNKTTIQPPSSKNNAIKPAVTTRKPSTTTSLPSRGPVQVPAFVLAWWADEAVAAQQPKEQQPNIFTTTTMKPVISPFVSGAANKTLPTIKSEQVVEKNKSVSVHHSKGETAEFHVTTLKPVAYVPTVKPNSTVVLPNTTQSVKGDSTPLTTIAPSMFSAEYPSVANSTAANNISTVASVMANKAQANATLSVLQSSIKCSWKFNESSLFEKVNGAIVCDKMVRFSNLIFYS